MTGEREAVLRYLEEIVERKSLLGLSFVRDGRPNDFEKHGIIKKGGDDDFFSSFGRGEESPLLGEKFWVSDCTELGSVEKKGVDVMYAARKEKDKG